MLAPLALLFAFFIGLVASNAQAHVKWFTKVGTDMPPLTFAEFNQTPFWALLALSLATLVVLVYVDRRFENWAPYQKLDRYLDQFADRSTLILRIFAGASLLLSWQADSMIAPEIHVPAAFWGWLQFALAICLLLRPLVPIAGLGMIAIFGLSVSQYGMFHMLDYLFYLGVGFALFISNTTRPRIADLARPALFGGLGFSLCWVALEKLFYPMWGIDVLHQHPALTMGLSPEFFLMACAFVEAALGYLLVICLLQRPLAVIITLTFFTTSTFFGKAEVVGHTLLHGILLVFVVAKNGGFYRPPIVFHRSLGLKMAFAAVNFVILLAGLAIPYRWLSQNSFEHPHHQETNVPSSR